MKYSLGISNYLEEISSLSHSIVFLYFFALITEEGFLPFQDHPPKKEMLHSEELYIKRLNDPDNHYGVITHLELDILECEVKWVLGSIILNKANEGDRIPSELFKILKDDAVKVLQLNMPAKLENSAMATGLEKVSFHSNPKERQCERMFKLQYNCAHFTC